MSWWSWWVGCSTAAAKRYQRRVFVAMSLYLVILFACVKLARTVPMHGWKLYTVALLPALPIIAVLGLMARYLQEETDEYLRMLTVRALMFAAAALLGTIVVNDFLRTIAHGAPIEPFVCFVIFFAAFGVAQAVQKLAARGGSDE